MAIMPYNTDRMSSTLLDLTSSSLNEANATDKRAKTAEFLATTESRRKKQNAENAMQAQSAAMQQEGNEAVQETGLHKEAAVTGTQAAVQGNKTRVKASAQESDYYDLNSINSEDDWQRAVQNAIDDGLSTGQIEDLYGPIEGGYQPHIIETRAARAARNAQAYNEQLLKREELQSLESRTAANNATSRANVQDQIYAQVAIASMQKQATVSAARAQAMQSPYDIIDQKDLPVYTADQFLQDVDASGAGDEKWGKIPPETKAMIAEKAAGAFKAIVTQQYTSWSTRVGAAAQGALPPPPLDEHPGLHTQRFIDLALLQATNRASTMTSSPGVDQLAVDHLNKLKDTNNSAYHKYKQAYPDQPDIWIIRRILGDLNAEQ